MVPLSVFWTASEARAAASKREVIDSEEKEIISQSATTFLLTGS